MGLNKNREVSYIYNVKWKRKHNLPTSNMMIYCGYYYGFPPCKYITTKTYGWRENQNRLTIKLV